MECETMNDATLLDPTRLEACLAQALLAQAPASLRPVGSVRLLGDLHLVALEAGRGLSLGGVKRREQLPVAGTEVTVSLLVGDAVLGFQVQLLGAEGHPALLRLAWPTTAEIRERKEVRVGTPDLPPLYARVRLGQDCFDAEVLNLTETGLGLGFNRVLSVGIHDQLEVETELPGPTKFLAIGSVRHVEVMEEDALPTRVGLVLGCMTDGAREALRRFIQARRTDRSENLRQGN